MIPKGFFPIQDTGLIQGFAEAAQETSPDQMMRLMHVVGDVILADPDVARLRLADRFHRQRADRQYRAVFHYAQAARRAQAHLVTDHRPAAAAACQDAGRESVPAADPGHQCRRPHRPRQLSVHLAGHKYRRAERVVAKASREVAHAAAARRRHQRSVGQRAEIADHHQPRPGGALRHLGAGDRRYLERRLRPAPDHAIFHPAQNLFRRAGDPARIAEGPLDARSPLREVAADRRRGAAVRSRHRRLQRRRAAFDCPSGPIPRGDDHVQSETRRRARPGRRRRQRGVAPDRHAGLDHPDLPGQRAGVPDLAAQRAGADRRRADRRLHHPRHPLRKLHPPADNSLDLAVGRHRRAVGAEPRPYGSVGDRHHRHHSAHRHRQEERHHAGRLRHFRRARPPHGAARRHPRSLPACASARS